MWIHHIIRDDAPVWARIARPALAETGNVVQDAILSLVKCLRCTLKSYNKGETVYLAGNFVRKIGIVAAGRVRIVKDDAWGNSNIALSSAGWDAFEALWEFKRHTLV
jgi:hypothetical protein